MNPLKVKELKEGWLIILATFLQYVIGYPANILPMSAILFAPKYEKFKASGTEEAIVIGLFTVSMNIVSIFVSPLVNARSPRFVAVIATTCQVSGLLICSISDSLPVIMVGFGVVTGSGVGLSLVNNIIIVKKHFPNSIGIAFGVALTLICIVGLLIPQILQELINYFQSQNDLVNQWTTVIYALMGSIGFFGAILMTSQSGNEEAVVTEIDSIEIDAQPSHFITEYVGLLKNPFYIVTAFVNSCCFSMMVYFISLIGPIVSTRGFEEESSNFVTIFSAANASSLLPMGLLGDSTLLKKYLKYPKKFLYMFCCFGLILAMLIFSYTTSFTSLVVGTILTGIFSSGIFITTNLVYFDCFQTKFESAVGLSNLFRCVFALSINPLAGYFVSLPSCEDLHCSLNFLSGAICFLIVVWTGASRIIDNHNKRLSAEAVVQWKKEEGVNIVGDKT